MYNQVDRLASVIEATSSWTYNSTTARYARGSSANRVEFVRGMDDEAINLILVTNSYSDVANVYCDFYMGLDAIAIHSSLGRNRNASVAMAQSNPALWSGYPGAGFHFMAWCENIQGTGVATYFSGGAFSSGIRGTIKC